VRQVRVRVRVAAAVRLVLLLNRRSGVAEAIVDSVLEQKLLLSRP
jgi:hypothetical protein